MKSFLSSSSKFQHRLTQLLLLIRTIGVVWLVRIGLWVLPFRLLRGIIARISKPGRCLGRIKPEQIAWAVAVTSRFVPVATCLTQALTTDLLLRRAGYQGSLHIGVAKGINGRLKAHAWLEYEGTILIGGRVRHGFSQLPPIETG